MQYLVYIVRYLRYIIHYLLSEYKDILKLMGAYMIILSTMIQIGIEKNNQTFINLFKSPIIYFFTIFSISLFITNDDVRISIICTIFYFVLLRSIDLYSDELVNRPNHPNKKTN